MTVSEIGEELVAGCRENRVIDNLAKIYAPDAISVEAKDATGLGLESHGIAAIKVKQEAFAAAYDVTSTEADGPMVHGEDRFAVIFRIKGRDRASGDSFEMREVAIYHVAGGKIVREEFFY